MWGFCKQSDLTLGARDRVGLERTALGGPLAQASSPHPATARTEPCAMRPPWGEWAPAASPPLTSNGRSTSLVPGTLLSSPVDLRPQSRKPQKGRAVRKLPSPQSILPRGPES